MQYNLKYRINNYFENNNNYIKLVCKPILITGGEKIKNLYKDSITYSFFVSPAIKYGEMLRYAQNHVFKLYINGISFYHTLQLIKHRIRHKKFLEIPSIIRYCTFNILYANIWGSGESRVLYKHPKGVRVKGLAIYAEDDPILPSFLVKDYANYCEVRKLEHGGHVGFFDIYDLRGPREHEKIILEKIQEILATDNEKSIE